MIRVVPQIAVLCYGVAVALSRICDKKHYWNDVVVGSLIGGLIGLSTVSYSYYHSIDDYHNDDIDGDSMWEWSPFVYYALL